jgi:hypothetical protein
MINATKITKTVAITVPNQIPVEPSVVVFEILLLVSISVAIEEKHVTI